MSITGEHFAEMQAILQEAIRFYQPKVVCFLLSGGHDSFTSTYFAYEAMTRLYRETNWLMPVDAPQFKVVHVDTGIGLPETRAHVEKVSQLLNWPLCVYKTPESYEAIVKQYGFPGPSAHRFMYIRLKERALVQLVRDHTPQSPWKARLSEALAQSRVLPLNWFRLYLFALEQEYKLYVKSDEYRNYQEQRKSKLLFLTGVRLDESVRRMGHVKAIQVQGRRIWVAPMLNVSKAEIIDFMWSISPSFRSPVVETLHMSGECLCGSFSHPGELAEITFWFPETGAYLRELERIVQGEGFPWGWEDAPANWWNEMKQGQLFLPGFSPLCSSCQASHEANEGLCHDCI